MILSLSRSACSVLALAGLLAATPIVATPPVNATVERQGPDRVLVRWTADKPVDVLLAEHADSPPSAARMVSAKDADGQAEIVIGGLQRRYVLLRNSVTGEVTPVAERALPLEGGSNFRDIGGYPAANGKHVKWGLIFRSGATPLITAADRQQIAALGLANLVDLRSDEERQLAPSRIDGVPYIAVGYAMGTMGVSGGMAEVYAKMPASFAPQIRQIFAKLLRQEGPLAYNCSAGQDRTGFTTAVVLSALGTPYPVIVADYHLSTTYRRPEFEMPKLDPALYPDNAAAQLFARYQSDPRLAKPQPLKTPDGTAYLDFAFAELDRTWGGVDGYLHQAIGLTDADIAKLRATYTE